MAGGLILIAVGLTIVYGGMAELVDWLRSRHRRRRVSAVIVGLHEPVAVNPGSRGRSPVFRFTTEEGQVIDALQAEVDAQQNDEPGEDPASEPPGDDAGEDWPPVAGPGGGA